MSPDVNTHQPSTDASSLVILSPASVAILRAFLREPTNYSIDGMERQLKQKTAGNPALFTAADEVSLPGC